MVRVAINGFGRIGRRVFRLLQSHPTIEVVAINDLADTKTLAHLLKYDSIHGTLKKTISCDDTHINIDEITIPVLNKSHPKDLNWRPYNVDTIISNASCTTNNAAPMLSIINKLCGINQAYITTVHSYTTDQSLHDQPHKDLRRARAAGQSIVPTTTGAAKALTKVFPELADCIGGCGIRVPVINGSLTDITFNVKKETSVEAINKAFKDAAETTFKGVLEYTEDPIVSIDIVGNTHSCVFDAQMTSVIGTMVKIIGWYDNETGYSSRIVDLIYRLKV